ncbi:MAG: aldolase/citrate lyase family protein [candidate division NC10 bacterium]|nr:aldolase/citrate lyase family protein [candidate division NC10 bacterium]
MAINPVKAKLKEGKPVMGAVMITPSLGNMQVLSRSGLDWVWIDMEHGPINLESAHALILATQGTGAIPVVRIPWKEDWMAKRVMDAGAMGVVFPFIKTREEAEAAVAAVKYPPEGVRGFSPALAAHRQGLSVADYPLWANENVLCLLLIEHQEAVKHIDSILSVPGIDAAIIGHMDLSGSYGLLGQITHPQVAGAMKEILEAGKRHQVPVGIAAATADAIKQRLTEGFQWISIGSDIVLLTGAVHQLLSALR